MSVFEISAFCSEPDYVSPWMRKPGGIASGTCFCVRAVMPDCTRNVLVTCAHCVCHATRCHVKSQGNEYPAKILIRAPEYDIAILSVPDELRTQPLDICDTLDPPDGLHVIGFPTGGWNQVTAFGHFSRIESLERFGVSTVSMHIDVTTLCGNSGSPVISNDQHAVIGMLWGRVARDKTSQGHACVTPARYILEVIRGNIAPPFLPLCTCHTKSQLRRDFFGVDSGVIVTSIEEHAGECPFEVNDVVTAINGEPIGRDGLLRVGRFRVSPQAFVTLFRGVLDFGVTRNRRAMQITYAPRASNFSIPRHPEACSLGYAIVGDRVFTQTSVPLGEQMDIQDTIRAFTEKVNGARVVLTGSFADDQQNITAPSFVKSANGVKVRTLAEFVAAIDSSCERSCERNVIMFTDDVVLVSGPNTLPQRLGIADRGRIFPQES